MENPPHSDPNESVHFSEFQLEEARMPIQARPFPILYVDELEIGEDSLWLTASLIRFGDDHRTAIAAVG